MAFPIFISAIFVCFQCFSQAENVFSRYRMENKITQDFSNDEKLHPIHFNIYKQCPNQICDKKQFTKYPEEYISKLVFEKKAVKQSFLNMVQIHVNDSVPNDFPGRINSFSSSTEKRLCQAKSKSVVPLVMRNINNQWRYIVNLESNDNLRQLCQIEICLEDKGQGYCGQIDEGRGRCTQQFREITFMVYEDDKFFFDTFSVPDVCMCTSSSCAVKF